MTDPRDQASPPTKPALRQRARAVDDDDAADDLTHLEPIEMPYDAVDDERSPLLDGAEARSRRSSVQAWPGHEEFAALKWWNRPSIFWLVPFFFLFTLAFGGTLVPKVNLIVGLICRQYLAEHSVQPVLPVLLGDTLPECKDSAVEVLVTRFSMYMSIITGVMGAIVSPQLGALSDRFGRKPVLVYTAVGGLVSEVITILCGRFPEAFSYVWILVGSFFEGVCGGFIVGMAVTHSYATDCTAPKKRAASFAIFHACLFSGIALGPLLAGYIVKWTGELLSVFYFALACHTVFVCCILCFVPESLSKKRQAEAREQYREERARAAQQPHSLKGFLESINIFKTLKVLCPTGPGSAQVRYNLMLLAAVDTIIFGVAMGVVSVLAVYLTFQFGWDNFQTSLYFSAANTTRVTALIVVLPLVNRFLRRGATAGELISRSTGSDKFEIGVIRFSVFLEVVGYAGYAAAPTPALFICSGLVAAVGGIGSPTLQSSLTKHVPVNQTGQVLGAVGLLHSVARVVSPLTVNLIYASTSTTFPQAIFVVLGSCFGAAFLCSLFIRPHVYVRSDGLPATIDSDEEETLLDEEIAAA